MSRHIRCVFLVLLLIATAEAAPSGDPLAQLRKQGEVVTVRRHPGPIPLDPGDKAWEQAKPAKITLYPQVTTKPKSSLRDTAAASVKALYNGKELALSIEWSDPRRAEKHGVGTFADAVSVQIPVRYGPGIRLPYVGMGDLGHRVALWFWRAGGTVETLAAEGFGSLSVQPARPAGGPSDRVQAKGAWKVDLPALPVGRPAGKAGTWQVVFKRSLQAPPGDYAVQLQPAKQGLVPIALAIWNGEAAQRDGNKLLSSWHLLHFEKGRVDRRYVKSLLWSPKIQGNPDAGKALMAKSGCMACHIYPGNQIRTEVGPDLTYIGGMHRPEYLLESLTHPSAVIVPGKAYYAVKEGKKVSIMPAVKLPEKDLYHLVEFLRTLR